MGRDLWIRCVESDITSAALSSWLKHLSCGDKGCNLVRSTGGKALMQGEAPKQFLVQTQSSLIRQEGDTGEEGGRIE